MRTSVVGESQKTTGATSTPRGTGTVNRSPGRSGFWTVTPRAFPSRFPPSWPSGSVTHAPQRWSGLSDTEDETPLKPAGSIKPAKLGPLVGIIREVLEEAIEAGGSTLKDYAAADGALGYFQHRFRAYDREGEPCANPGCKGTIAREVQAGRSTFYCRTCQK